MGFPRPNEYVSACSTSVGRDSALRCRFPDSCKDDTISRSEDMQSDSGSPTGEDGSSFRYMSVSCFFNNRD